MHPGLDKTKLLEHMRTEFEFVKRTLALLTPEVMTLRGADNDWTVKDALAHLTAWDRRFNRWMADHARGETPSVPEEGITWVDLAGLNESTAERDRLCDLDEILEEFEDSFLRLEEIVSKLPEDLFADRDSVPWHNGWFSELVARNTFLYQDHFGRIRRWIQKEGLVSRDCPGDASSVERLSEPAPRPAYRSRRRARRRSLGH